MSRQILHEVLPPSEEVATEKPDVISRWDSHELSPERHEGAKQMSQGAAHVPYSCSRTCYNTEGVADYRQFVGLQVLDDIGATHLASTDTDSDDGENHDGDLVSNDAVKHEEEQRSHIFGASLPCLAGCVTPSRPVLLGQNGEDVQEIVQWYFVCQLPEQDYELFRSVQTHWVQGMWDMSRHSRAFASVVSAFALHKKATIWSPQTKSKYYEQKGQIIQNIISDIKGSPNGPDPVIVSAMAILAYFDIRDEQHDAASTHLAAVRHFIDMPKMSPQGWLVAAWTDLRQALHSVTEPVLPFYVPVAFRNVHETLLLKQPEAFKLGVTNALQCPRSSVFTLHMASDLFGKLHTLCNFSRFPDSSETPPFGQVYALEYILRVVQARANHSKGDVSASPIMLITSAIQLHVWMATRFYTPQARETHLGLLKIACEAIDSFEDVVTQFYIAAGLQSLLWVLFSLVSSFRAHEMSQTTRTLGLLYQCLRKARINSCDEFEARLRRWPWLDNWHPAQTGAVWDMLCARYSDLVPRTVRPELTDTNQDTHKARHRWFVGGFEFHNSR